MEIRSVPSSATWPLRQQILRPHQPLSEMNFPGDDAPGTRHFGAWDGTQQIGIASLYEEALEGEPQSAAWRLRGMAVLTSRHGRGIGKQLVEHCAEYARKQRGALIWCNAREVALPFYEKLRFECLLGPFEIPGIGAHFLLIRRL